jgi:peptide/nickel transport system substrate-binding protein
MRKFLPAVLAVMLILLTACAQVATLQPLPSQVVPSPVLTVVTPTITPVPVRSLSICLGQEPSSLYIYAASSRAMWSVLEAVYDGPIDTAHYTPHPVILESLPNSADGSARLQLVEVKAGQEVVNASGNLAVLEAGLQVFPAGCESSACAIAWDGQSALQMDQQILRFRLKSGILWSDGAALGAADSVFSYQVANDPASPVNRWLLDRTASYSAADERTVEWVGVPGYLPARYESLFFIPLPQHSLGTLSAEAILASEEVNRQPLGWGPYVIEDWVTGDHITLHKNTRYFRTTEGLPAFDKLVFRFLGEQTDNNLNALVNGECDLVDLTTLADEEVARVLQMDYENTLQVYFTQGPEWEHLDFGIKPASYDDGYNVATDRPDFFSDVRVRQAVAACLDRQGFIASNNLFSRTIIPTGMYPPDSPLYPSDLQAVPFDPVEGSRLLKEVGWMDADGDPATPRTAQGVNGVLDGTPFSLTYQTTDSSLRQKAAAWFTASLAQCGIQVNVETSTSAELFAAGPAGKIFGRQFDLVQFTWVGGSQTPCYLYETNQIPSASNLWIGANVSGFSNPEFDAACQSLRETRPEQVDLIKARSTEVNRLFAELLPVIPLYYPIKISASRLDLCGLQVDGSARSNIWNLETLNYGTTCTP